MIPIIVQKVERFAMNTSFGGLQHREHRRAPDHPVLLRLAELHLPVFCIPIWRILEYIRKTVDVGVDAQVGALGGLELLFDLRT